MASALQRAWAGRGPLAWLLLPLSLAFAAVVLARRALYRAGWLRATRVGVPVIVVGNLVAGGAGKTPVVLALLEHLRSRGLRAGVVSRGYGRRTDDCREVNPDSDPADVGDEPLLVRRRGEVPVVVAARRAEAASELLARHPATQVLVCDDGLQHYALHRDIEICVFDERGVGNGWLLPAGPLREPASRQVDLTLRPARRLAGHAVQADGTRRELAAFQGAPVHAVAGIARPDAFFGMLREAGLTLASSTALPDHADFVGTPLPAATLLCTEKDAVKLWRIRPDAWAVPLAIEIDPAFWRELDSRLDAKLSSAHGSQTP